MFLGIALLLGIFAAVGACTPAPPPSTATPPPSTATPVPAPPTATEVVIPTPSPSPLPTNSPTVVVVVNTPTPTVLTVDEMLKRTIPSVVRIQTADADGTGFSILVREDDTLFLTNAHVVEGAQTVTVVAQDGKSRHGTVLARDENVDLAIVRLADNRVAPALPIGDASALRVGDPLYVVGFALGSELNGDPSVTRGILSGRRTIDTIDFVQTDAAINPGNSGGPLLDAHGKVVGIATMAYDQSVAQGINFALPSDLIQSDFDKLLRAANVAPAEPKSGWQVIPTDGAPGSRSGHVSVWTGKEMLVWGGWNGTNLLGDGARYNPDKNTWSDLPTKGAPSARNGSVGVWTGKELLIWGGFSRDSKTQGVWDTDGGRFDPSANSWSVLPKGVLTGREYVGAVWTGTEAIFWGGTHTSGNDTICDGDGARFNPTTNRWTPVASKGAPSLRSSPSVVWTGQEMIVWGGSSCDPLNPGFVDTGAAYDPKADTWRPLSRVGAPTGRFGQVAVWTGHDMVIWGGYWYGGELANGARYDPAANAWSVLPSDGAPSPRRNASAVWTGTEIIVWGGYQKVGTDPKTNKATFAYFDDGARFDPKKNVWRPLPAFEAPRGRVSNSALWTGTDLIIWGGYGNRLGSAKQSQAYLFTGSLYQVGATPGG